MLQRNAGLPSQSSGSQAGDSMAGFPPVSLQGGSRLSNLVSPKYLANASVEAVIVGEQHLVFTLLEREFAFKAEHVQGVERLGSITPIPNVASWVSGVINLRGSIASVVDLRAFLGLESLPYNPRTRLLSVNYNDMVICLVVDSVSEMVPIAPSAVIAVSRQANIPQWVAPYASGSAFVGKRGIVLLDAARLLFSEKMQHYS